MEKENKKQIGVYILWAVIILLIVLSYFIIKPYLIALVSAFILAYLTKPLYNRLEKTVSKNISAAICILTVIIIIVLPLGLLITGITQQASLALKQQDINQFLSQISSSPFLEKLGLDFINIKEEGLTLLISLFTSLVRYIPLMLISILITLWGMFYILIKWDNLALNLKEYLPFKDKENIIKKIDCATKGIVHGTLIIALVELVIALIGFYLLGISSYVLLAVMIAVSVFILNPMIVWIPLAIFYLAIENYYIAIGVVVIGLIINIFAEFYLQGKIIEKKSEINPLIRFLGVIGGVPLFGLFGFIIGPMLLVYTLKILEESIKQKDN